LVFASSMPENQLHRAAFIDRDGVINEERNYVYKSDDFVLLPGAIEGLRTLQGAGFMLVVITNQAGIGRGLYSEQDFNKLTAHMSALLLCAEVDLAGVYYCPHHPLHGVGHYKVDCACRKPKPGMLLQAAHELHINLATSVLIGDKLSDIQAGRAAGVEKCILVTSGHSVEASDSAIADVTVQGLMHAAQWCVQNIN
jgi:D-glycero-D-manno-heptose 1,7-bisphosphate phosphatase